MNPQEYLRGILLSAEGIHPQGDDERAVQGFIIGAAHALKWTLKLRPENWEEPATSDCEQDYAEWARAVRSDTVLEYPDLLFGYYLNDALLRCDALFSKVRKATGAEFPSEIAAQADRLCKAYPDRMYGVSETAVTPKYLAEILGKMVTFFLETRRARER